MQSFRAVISVQSEVSVNRQSSDEEEADMRFVYGFSNGTSTAAVEEYRQRYSLRQIADRRVFARVHQYVHEKGSFPSGNRRAERQVQRNVDEDENIDMAGRSARTLHYEFLPALTFRL